MMDTGPETGFTAATLFDVLRRRRSRRFAAGAEIQGGPLAWRSALPPQPLSHTEEAALAFAANGVTGHPLTEMDFRRPETGGPGGGNIVTHLIGRTVPSGDSIHAVTLFITNDEGTWLLRRPQDFAAAEIPELVRAGSEGRLAELYDRSRIRLSDTRTEIPRGVPHTPTFNLWSANLPGSTFFVPVSELTTLYINVLLAIFSAEPGVLLLDERNRFQPAGLKRFTRSRGGHLHEDLATGRVGTVGMAETLLLEIAAIEQGAMLQNLGLAAAALDIGGFPVYAAHPFAWPQALGFRMEDVPFSRTIGAGHALAGILRLLRRDVPVPTAVGLETNGVVLLKPFCPPYYASMSDAVRAFVDYKFSPAHGTLRAAGVATAWREPAALRQNIPGYSDEAVAATSAYCEYIYARYGRFPGLNGPFRTLTAYQAHHLDPGFYAAFYTSRMSP